VTGISSHSATNAICSWCLTADLINGGNGQWIIVCHRTKTDIHPILMYSKLITQTIAQNNENSLHKYGSRNALTMNRAIRRCSGNSTIITVVTKVTYTKGAI
jgi:hypothetical protein